MKFIFSCILSLNLFLHCSQAAHAQNEVDTVRTYGVRIGVDLGKVAYFFLTNQTNRTLEFAADMNYKNILLAGEAGFSMLNIDKQNYNYTSNGVFARVGMEHNLLKNGGDNYIFVGARYGISQFSYQVADIVITDQYWPGYNVASDQQSVMAHWGEGVGGVKVNVFSNVFLGFTARFKLRIAQSDYAQVDPLLIPGFGNPAKRNAMGFNYYVYYLFPLKKK
jgi:hypothetical protein